MQTHVIYQRYNFFSLQSIFKGGNNIWKFLKNCSSDGQRSVCVWECSKAGQVGSLLSTCPPSCHTGIHPPKISYLKLKLLKTYLLLLPTFLEGYFISIWKENFLYFSNILKYFLSHCENSWLINKWRRKFSLLLEYF